MRSRDQTAICDWTKKKNQKAETCLGNHLLIIYRMYSKKNLHRCFQSSLDENKVEVKQHLGQMSNRLPQVSYKFTNIRCYPDDDWTIPHEHVSLRSWCCLHISHFKSMSMLANEILVCESALFSLLVQPAPNIQADKF